ncbi:MAG: DoxX family protein [Sphingomonadales bacterium]|nr:DoxX family protein [Sphingomonadales bacterium]PIX66657.1 MAG: DoxX family protein [Sphingomonadales bacterium CG_4_10_14_3_um_filter_58_15]NCO49779.1 DoxX family protein [Sphingomonadales bacterium]NCP27565.1 DoxX family protein [Sphingomonadales bacterium]NCP43931.1 DoxX family protein [Sphingomonadales bacterium]
MKAIPKKLIRAVSGTVPEGIALLFTRVALAGIFWRSARTKVEDGSLLTIKDTTFFQFSDAPFNQVPILNGELGAYVTTYTEHVLPILLLLGLATRLGALGVLGMTLVIQVFVFPEMAVWWQTHILWVAMALVLIVRGGGLFSLDRLIGHRLG